MSNLLPPVFRETFERLRNKLLGLYIRDWLLIGALGLLAVLLIFIALDRLLYISSWVRPLFFILGCLGAFVVGPLRFYYKAYSKRSELSLAKVIKGKRKRLGDRIQGALEIAEHTSSGESRELQLAALEQIGLEAKKLDFKEVIPRLPHQVYITVIGGALMLLFLGLSLLPKQFTNASKRFFMPLSEIQRYSAIRFDELPRKHYVVIGQPSEFIVKLKENSFSEEQLIGIGKLEGHPSISEEYENGFHFLLPPIKKATTFSIETGDAYQTVKIIPRARPRIDSLLVHQYLPEYLQLEERVLNVKRKRVEVVSGSNIKLEVFSSSELKSVVSDGQLSFEHAGEKAWSNSIDVEESTETKIAITDRYGLKSFPDKSLHIDVIEDKAPTARLIFSSRELNLLPHETIDFETYAEDDFGVNSVNLRLNSLTRITETKKLLVSTGSPKASKITSDFVFNPEVLGLIPDSYELIAEAVDYYPDREYSGSEPITVHLLSYENHASLVKSQFTALIDNLDEYYQHALSLHHENQLLDRMLTKAPHDYELTNRMNEAVTKERKAIKLFNSVATPVQDLAKDAFRNHELDRSIQLALTLLSQRLLNEFPEKLNEETSYYQKAADNRFSAQVRQTYQAQGISIEKQTLADLRKLLNEMREFDRKFEASNFIQRLQSLSKSHDDRAQQMLRNYDKFMGNTPSELDPALQQFNIDYANLQTSDLQTLRWIEDDMRNYASYAEKPVFNTLADKISDSGVYVQMRKTNEMLLSNRRYISIILTQEWAELIKAWAEELSSEVTGSGGSGGGAGGASQPEQDAEFMLRIMEIIREQQNVRGKTRALDQHKKLLKPNE